MELHQLQLTVALVLTTSKNGFIKKKTTYTEKLHELTQNSDRRTYIRANSILCKLIILQGKHTHSIKRLEDAVIQICTTQSDENNVQEHFKLSVYSISLLVYVFIVTFSLGDTYCCLKLRFSPIIQ